MLLTDLNKIRNNFGPKLNTPEHIKQSQRCDLDYPIILVRKNNKYIKVIDGHHRIMKAVSNNLSTIKARVLNVDDFCKMDEFLITKLVKVLFMYWSNVNNYDTERQFHSKNI